MMRFYCHMTAYRPMLSGTEVSNSASRTEAYSLDEALQAAAEEAARSVILSDTGDNPRQALAWI
ncbi:hypothetical protein BP422_24260 [Brevibacillus formosus]|uniref:Uncharacterized protein n=1 Tax=Brevibacillus formosus TaxID=54913 RepID=A0A220MNP0_9BACL|nr:hypothetical protein BP422_24260 [Brevibacillus formosus]